MDCSRKAAWESLDHFEGDRNEALWRKDWHASLSVKSQGILGRDERSFLHQSLSTPCIDVLAKAEGAWLEMADGRRILDFHGNSVHHIGHGNAVVKAALIKQMDELPFSPRRYANEPAVQLAERFQRLSNGLLRRTLMMPSGSSAISAGLRLARLASGKNKVVTWWDSFHGATFDNCAIGGERMFRDGAEHLSNASLHIAPPQSLAPQGLADPEVLDYLARKEGNVGVFLAEPVRHSGVLIPPVGYWQEIRRICDRHGILLFFDEIPCGLGRLGHMFAYQHAGVEPDLVALGKALGGGIFPQAALLCRESLNVVRSGSVGHFTHEKSPLGAACALATLDVIENENLCERANQIGLTLRDRLTQEKLPNMVEIRHAGALVGIELTDDACAEKALLRSLHAGLSFKVGAGNVLTLNPPLNITDQELNMATNILISVLS